MAVGTNYLSRSLASFPLRSFLSRHGFTRVSSPLALSLSSPSLSPSSPSSPGTPSFYNSGSFSPMVSQVFCKTFLSMNFFLSQNGNETMSPHGNSVSVCTIRQLSYNVGPSTVPYDAEKQNKVYFIGTLGTDFEVMNYGDKKKASVRLAVRRMVKGIDETDWYTVVVWDELAERLPNQLRKGTRVMVEGRMNLDKYEGKDGIKRISVKVVAKAVHLVQDMEAVGRFEDTYVDPYPPPFPSETNQSQTSNNYKSTSGRSSKALTLEEIWTDFFTDPTNWYDKRQWKTDPKQPDFTRKSVLSEEGERPEALWIDNRFKPSWVDQKLRELFEDQTEEKEEGYQPSQWAGGEKYRQ